MTGPGWTDGHIRVLAYSAVAAVTALLGVILIIGPARHAIEKSLQGKAFRTLWMHLAPLGLAAAAMIAVWVLALGGFSIVLQGLRVEPNETTRERPYIGHNILFTRQAFGLDKVEERGFPASEEFNSQLVKANQHLSDNVRLWDWCALKAVHKQFQEIRLYYEFAYVNIDRYTVDGDYRQVMASAREMQLANLPPQSWTFVNRRFK